MSDIVHDPQCHFISKACISLYGCSHECRVVSCRVVSCRVVSCRVIHACVFKEMELEYHVFVVLFR